MQSKGKSMEIIPGIHQNALSGRKVFIEKEKIDFKSIGMLKHYLYWSNKNLNYFL